MPKATKSTGELVLIENCYIDIPDLGKRIPMYILPEISDSKGANYQGESGIGRSSSFKSYHNSEDRTISWTAHFMNCKQGDAEKIIDWMRVMEACVYPQQKGGTPYSPPPICKLRCGQQFSGSDDVCAVMKSYSVKFDPSVPWDEDRYLPYKLDVDMQFDVVYNQSSLPNADKIMKSGY